jgi:hypothetical protein
MIVTLFSNIVTVWAVLEADAELSPRFINVNNFFCLIYTIISWFVVSIMR